MKSINRNVSLMSTLEINFEWENMSDASIDDDQFEDIDELNQTHVSN